MNEANQVKVVKFPKSKAKINPKVSSTHRRQLRQQLLSGAAVSVVALTLTGLSLNHLAHGISIVTHADMVESWAMAVGIDLGFVAVEMAQMSVSNEKLSKEINQYAGPTIVGTMVGSAVLNAFAFAAQAEGWMLVPAIIMGLVIPAMIYSLTKIGTKMYLGCR